MSDLEEVFVERVKSRLKELGETPFSLEQKANLPRDALRNILRDDSKRARPNLKRVQEVCEALGLEAYIGPPKPRISDELAERLGSALSFELHAMNAAYPRGDIFARMASGEDLDLELTIFSEDKKKRRVQALPREFAKVPLHDASLSAGGGRFNDEHGNLEYLAFRRSWLRKVGVDASNAVMARITSGEMGESMLPTICPGDMVLIDTSRKDIPPRPANYKSRKSPVFAFATEDGARVKRLAQLSDMVILVSDNPDYPPEFIPKAEWDQVNVIGKVVWWGHTAEE
ncbi:helix-turn-helix transcriptional regulator [Maritimibacter alkaliphilus]|uniref:S24 family peptidase n=1 Tax=Maritimibacter alkaliphilus TaxID=404236 RepID=UPI001C94B77A|nr:S24 family peptidase [Maritimibacter alkaliphilus]MBY6091043.1 S24 family peptidase [Maritimibacter alkaliphilus]